MQTLTLFLILPVNEGRQQERNKERFPCTPLFSLENFFLGFSLASLSLYCCCFGGKQENSPPFLFERFVSIYYTVLRTWVVVIFSVFVENMTMVENSFGRWSNDVFFSAAEEVQESADIMESLYRTWERERGELQSDDLAELCRELHTTIGTSKWQLEEFEKAVQFSHGSRCPDNTKARHRQFIVAIGSQISRIEKALRDSFIEEGKPPLRWVQLDEEERDDLAIFLSGSLGTSHDKEKKTYLRPSEGNQHHDEEIGMDAVRIASQREYVKGFKDIVTFNKDSKYLVELAATELPKTINEFHKHGDRLNEQSTSWSAPDIGAWKIVIADEDVQKEKPEVSSTAPAPAVGLGSILKSVGFTTKSGWFRNSFGKEKDEEKLPSKQLLAYHELRGIIRFPQQLFGQVGGIHRQLQSSQYHMPSSRSLQVTLVLLLTVFLIVPFMVYAS